MKISIVIPAFNEERLLGRSLEKIKLAANTFNQWGWESELIVCDNNSSDQTAQIARARNCGASAASGDWLLFIDADSEPTAELLADVARQISSGKCVAGGSTVKMETRQPLVFATILVWNLVSRTLKLLAGSFIFCETSAFRQISGFNEELFAAEELELSQRLKKLGRALGKRIVILHRHPLFTSARKVHLYSPRDHLRLLFRVLFDRRALKNREACHLWYDGRR